MSLLVFAFIFIVNPLVRTLKAPNYSEFVRLSPSISSFFENGLNCRFCMNLRFVVIGAKINEVPLKQTLYKIPYNHAFLAKKSKTYRKRNDAFFYEHPKKA